MHREIIEQDEKLQRLFQQANVLQQHKDIDDETKSSFVSYLCIRTFGYVESSVKTILREYVRTYSQDVPTFNFVNARLINLSLRRDQIIELIGQFDKQWSESLKNSITIDHGDSLRAIVVNRNEIAHGGDVDMSLRDLERYFRDAQEVVSHVFDACNT